jgi:hypothetical protein
MMRKTLLGLALLGTAFAMPSYAQTTPATPNRPAAGATTAPDTRSGATTATPRSESTPPAATIDSGTRTSASPTAGANSFTEGQARSRIEAAGFTGIDNLEKDDQGIWRGRAMRNGAQVSVSLDYQGNVSTR